jgi:pyruvate ferredoxin oxidoreductase alpha subunit
VAGEIKEVVDELRDKGEKVGLLKIRVFRPFPYVEIAEALSHARIIAVLDRSASMGAYGPLFTEIRTALYDVPSRPMIYNRTFGLGGRELFLDDIKAIFEQSEQYLQGGRIETVFDYLCVRGA